MSAVSYMKAYWHHEPREADEPVWLFSELDDDRNEVRKVDVFADGRMQAASSNFETGTTWLGLEPIPSLDEINSQDAFDAVEIDAEAFEVVWRQAMAQRRAAR